MKLKKEIRSRNKKMKHFAVYLNLETFTQIKNIAKTEKISMSELARYIIETYLEDK